MPSGKRKSKKPSSGAAEKPETPVKSDTKPKHAGGRPSLYPTIDQDLVRRLCEAGSTDTQISHVLGISEATLNNWKHAHPEFLESLKNWKDFADDKVERALYERATGYAHPDTHFSSFEGVVTMTPTVKRYPPDTAAAFIWLQNRRTDKWKHRIEAPKPSPEAVESRLAEIAKSMQERDGT